MGVPALVLTNAAGGLRAEWKPPALMQVTDHLNLQGVNPCIGPNIDSLGLQGRNNVGQEAGQVVVVLIQ